MEPVHLTATEGEISLPFNQQKKKEPKSNAKMMRDYRKRVKADPIKYQRYLEQERQRNNRRKRRRRKELKELSEQMLKNTAQTIQTETIGIQCKTEPLDQSLETYNNGAMAETALKSLNGCNIEFISKPPPHVAPAVQTNPFQTAKPAGQTPLEWNNVIQIRPSLPGELQKAFNIKIVKPANTSTTTTITNTNLQTETPNPGKLRFIVEPISATTTTCVKPPAKQMLGPATKPLESTKYKTATTSLNTVKNSSVDLPPSPNVISQDFKITLITLDQVPFRPKISVIRDRPRYGKTGNGYQRVGITAAKLIESTATNNVGSRTSDGTHDTDSSQDGDVEDVTPVSRLIDLTDDVSDGDSPASIPAFADLTNQQAEVNGINSTTKTNAVERIGLSSRNPAEEASKNKVNYLDSFVGFVTQQESETNKQRLVSKGMMWNRFT